MSKMAKKMVAVWVAAWVLVIAAVVLVVIGVTNHSEPTFINGVPKWDKSDFPLTLELSGHTEGTREPVTTAVRDINRQLGFRALVLPDSPIASPNIVFDMGVPHDDRWQESGGDSSLRHSGGHAVQCNVSISNVVLPNVLYRVVYHELGHCLGLAHDDFASSVMYPLTDGREEDLHLTGFTDDDVHALREEYR